jgi:hypothetical protein
LAAAEATGALIIRARSVDREDRELQARLTDKADQLRQGLVGDIKQTAAVQSEARKAGKKAQRTGAAAAKQAAENKTTIDKLERENEQLSRDVKQQQQQQQAANQAIKNLKVKVRLKKNKR